MTKGFILLFGKSEDTFDVNDKRSILLFGKSEDTADMNDKKFNSFFREKWWHSWYDSQKIHSIVGQSKNSWSQKNLQIVEE